MTAGTDRRELLADAAIDIIGRSGMRALTHRAVDSAADVPPGTTSYHFRTRRELLRGVLNRIADISTERLGRLPGPPTGKAPSAAPTSRSDRLREARALAERCAAFVDGQVTTLRTTTLARMACEIEVASDPELREILHAGDRFRTMAVGAVGRLGSADPPGARQRPDRVPGGAAVRSTGGNRVARLGSGRHRCRPRGDHRRGARLPGRDRSRGRLRRARVHGWSRLHGRGCRCSGRLPRTDDVP